MHFKAHQRQCGSGMETIMYKLLGKQPRVLLGTPQKKLPSQTASGVA